MNRSETIRILSVLRAAYPTFYKGMSGADLDSIVALWQQMFAEAPYALVDAAVRALIVADAKGYPPHIGAVHAHIRKLTAAPALTESEAWSQIERAAANGAYDSQREYDRLPPELQRIVGSPSQLHTWSQMERETFDSVIGSHVRRSFREQRQQQEELALLPGGAYP